MIFSFVCEGLAFEPPLGTCCAFFFHLARPCPFRVQRCCWLSAEKRYRHGRELLAISLKFPKLFLHRKSLATEVVHIVLPVATSVPPTGFQWLLRWALFCLQGENNWYYDKRVVRPPLEMFQHRLPWWLDVLGNLILMSIIFHLEFSQQTFKNGSVWMPNTEADSQIMSLIPCLIMVQSDPLLQTRKMIILLPWKKQTNKCICFCWIKWHFVDKLFDCEMVMIRQPHEVHSTYKDITLFEI